MAAPIVGWTAGVWPKKPSFWVAAVPIWVPVAVPSVIFIPSAHAPHATKHLRLSAIDMIEVAPATTVASLMCGVAG